MKFKTNKLSLNLVLASSLLAASIPAFAVTGDTDQPIHIESDQQSLDICLLYTSPSPRDIPWTISYAVFCLKKKKNKQNIGLV